MEIKNIIMKTRSIKKNYIFNLIYNITNLLVPLLIAPYLSRILEVDGVGIKSYTLSIVSNFILFASLGMAEYGQREIAKNLGISRSYVSRIEKRALEKLRKLLVDTISL